MTSNLKNPAFSAADVDRLLGMADENLEDWVINAADDDDLDDAKEREVEWRALRPKIIAAWRASEALLFAYARGKLSGGSTHWDDVDAAFDLALTDMQDEYLRVGVEAARAELTIDDWRTDVAAGETTLGFQDWLAQRAKEEICG